MFLHESLNSQKFKNDRKLQLLIKHVITPAQFLQLVQPDDPYMIIGTSIVDKEKKDQFIRQWNQKQYKIEGMKNIPKVTSQEYQTSLSIILKYFPQAGELIEQFSQKIKTASCRLCVKNRYFINIGMIIKKYINDGRKIEEDAKYLFNKILNTFFPFQQSSGQAPLNVSSYYDNIWIQPDRISGIGYDLIQGLSNCFNCAKKHLSRAKALYQQLYLGYPQHQQMMFNEFTQSNKVIQQAYTLYWDALGQLDMSSVQLAGDLTNLPKEYRDQIIDLANEIRIARISFQQDISVVPDWNRIRIDIQKLQNKIQKHVS